MIALAVSMASKHSIRLLPPLFGCLFLRSSLLPLATMSTFDRLTKINATISAKLDEAEAAWQEGKEALTALKNIPQLQYPPSINGEYSHLQAVSKNPQARSAVIARFGKPAFQANAFETLLFHSRLERRSTETRTGQLIRILRFARGMAEVMLEVNTVLEEKIEEAFARLRQTQKHLNLEGDLGWMVLAADVEERVERKLLEGGEELWRRHGVGAAVFERSERTAWVLGP